MGCLVMVLGFVAIVGGMFSLLWGMWLVASGAVGWLTGTVFTEEAIRGWGGHHFWGGWLSLGAGLLQIIVGFGLIFRASWAWLLAVIAAGLAMINPLVSLLGGHLLSVLGLIFPTILLVILMMPNVRRMFGRGTG